MTLELEREATAPTDLLSSVCQDGRLSRLGWMRHGITSRVVNVQPGEGNVGYGPPRDKEAAWRMRSAWGQAIGISSERLVGVHQVHGADVITAGASAAGLGARPGSQHAGRADALITNTPGLPLMTLHADCQPIFFVDPVRRSVGVAHAGWRGVVSDVVGASVQAMARSFGSKPNDLLVFLGPAIGVECYQVGDEVVEAWRSAFRHPDGMKAVRRHGSQPHFDLTEANRSLLRRAGVDPDHIGESGICTKCNGRDWFSHRGQGPSTGRFSAIIAISERSQP